MNRSAKNQKGKTVEIAQWANVCRRVCILNDLFQTVKANVSIARIDTLDRITSNDASLRIEEASELTTLDILKRKMPDGRISYLLHIKPSKFDRARVIPIGDGLGRDAKYVITLSRSSVWLGNLVWNGV